MRVREERGLRHLLGYLAQGHGAPRGGLVAPHGRHAAPPCASGVTMANKWPTLVAPGYLAQGHGAPHGRHAAPPCASGVTPTHSLPTNVPHLWPPATSRRPTGRRMGALWCRMGAMQRPLARVG